MPTLLERARMGMANALMGDQVRRLEESFQLMRRAYVDGPWELPPDELVRQLREVDPWLLQDLFWQAGWEALEGYGGDAGAERQRVVRESVRLYKYSPLAQWAIWLWGGWGLGDHVEVAPHDEAAEIWDEFWSADRNAYLLADDKIHELSNWLLVKGNRFFTFYVSTMDGEATVRLIDQDQMTILTNPDDSQEPWFYKRLWSPMGKAQQTWYYPDWHVAFRDDIEECWEKVVAANGLGPGAIRADEINEGTDVCVLHVAHNVKDEGSLWGWPITVAGRSWLSAHSHFLEARLSVAMAVAMFVRRKKVKGGSRAVESIRSTIASRLSQTKFYDTNPPAAPGSVELDNEAIDTTDLPLRTGASDADADNKMFQHQAGLGVGLFPTSFGLDTARWATALEMDKAQSMLFERYQTFWSAQFRKMVKIVLLFKEKHSGMAFENKGAKISVDTFSLADFPGVARTIGGLVRDALTPLVDDGTIPMPAAKDIVRSLWRISLQSLGVEDIGDLTDEEAWEEKPEPEPQSPLAVVPVAEQEEPDLSRGDLDEKMERVIRGALDEARAKIMGAIADEREPDYDEVRIVLIAALIPLLVEAAVFYAGQLEDHYAIYFDEAELQAVALTWASAYAEKRTDQLIATTRELVNAARLRTDEEMELLLGKAFDSRRAEKIGVTEITAGLVAGALLYQQLVLDRHGIEIEYTWFTMADERVCDICAPLHGKPESVWKAEFPDGPPAHALCRCWVVPPWKGAR